MANRDISRQLEMPIPSIFLNMNYQDISKNIKEMTFYIKYYRYILACLVFTCHERNLHKNKDACLHFFKEGLTKSKKVYNNFYTWAEEELDIPLRTASSLIRTIRLIHELNLGAEDVKRLVLIGLRKCYEILNYSKNADEFIHWMDRAEKVSARQLVIEVKNAREKEQGSSIELSKPKELKIVFRSEDDYALYKKGADYLRERHGQKQSDAKILSLLGSIAISVQPVSATDETLQLKDIIKSVENRFSVKLKVLEEENAVSRC